MVENSEEEDSGEAYRAGKTTCLRQKFKHLANLLIGFGRGRDVGAEETAHLVKHDGDGHGGNETSDNRYRNEFQEKAKFQKAKDHAVDSHHEGNGRCILRSRVRGINWTKVIDDTFSKKTDERRWSG